jgi:hypothetical protein
VDATRYKGTGLGQPEIHTAGGKAEEKRGHNLLSKGKLKHSHNTPMEAQGREEV